MKSGLVGRTSRVRANGKNLGKIYGCTAKNTLGTTTFQYILQRPLVQNPY